MVPAFADTVAFFAAGTVGQQTLAVAPVVEIEAAVLFSSAAAAAPPPCLPLLRPHQGWQEPAFGPGGLGCKVSVGNRVGEMVHVVAAGGTAVQRRAD